MENYNINSVTEWVPQRMMAGNCTYSILKATIKELKITQTRHDSTISMYQNSYRPHYALSNH